MSVLRGQSPALAELHVMMSSLMQSKHLSTAVIHQFTSTAAQKELSHMWVFLEPCLRVSPRFHCSQRLHYFLLSQTFMVANP